MSVGLVRRLSFTLFSLADYFFTNGLNIIWVKKKYSFTTVNDALYFRFLLSLWFVLFYYSLVNF